MVGRGIDIEITGALLWTDKIDTFGLIANLLHCILLLLDIHLFVCKSWKSLLYISGVSIIIYGQQLG